MPGPDLSFWQERFERGQTPWDRGSPHPQLQAWREQQLLDPARLDGPVLVPGCGTGHEVAWMAQAGIEVVGLDYAPRALERARERLRGIGSPVNASLVEADVLHWTPARPFAAIYEQTCLCALHPDHWTAYAAQLHRWLLPGGHLLALLMQAPREGATHGFVEGPPYHCDVNAVRALFPEPAWRWPKPPFARVQHPSLAFELAVALQRV